MGIFANAKEIKDKTRLPALREMEVDDIEDLYVRPAERIIEEEFQLQLTTDAYPAWFQGTFERYPSRAAKFMDDYKRSVWILVERLASNPHGYGSQNVRDSQVTFGRIIPVEVEAYMSRYRQPPTLFRR